MRHVDRRKRSAPITAGKPARVTVSENVEPAAGGFGKSADELQPVYTNQAALLDVGITDCGSFPKRHINSLLRLHFREHCAHSRQCPEQIDRRRTRRLQCPSRFGEVRVRGVRARGERHAVCRRCSDQRRTAHHHGFDRLRRISESLEVDGGELKGKTRLIDRPNGSGFRNPNRAVVRARYSHGSTPIPLVTSAGRRFRPLTVKLGALDATAARIAPPAWHPAAAAMPCSGALPTMLRMRHGAIPSLPARGGSRAAGSRHSTPRHRRNAGDAAAPGSNARPEREILGGFCPAGETGVLGYGDSSFAIDSGFSVARRRGYAASLAVIDSV